MTTTRKRTEERQPEIADAALRLIGSRGIAALTVAALAKELGLSGGALYRHFPSTDAILEAVARRAVELLGASTPAEGLAPREWLRQFAQARTETVGGHRGLSRLLLSDQFAFALPPAAAALLSEVVRATREGILGALVAGQRAGEIRSDLPAKALAPLVLGTIHMIAIHRARPGLPSAEGEPMNLFEVLLKLLDPPRAAKRGGGS